MEIKIDNENEIIKDLEKKQNERIKRYTKKLVNKKKTEEAINIILLKTKIEGIKKIEELKESYIKVDKKIKALLREELLKNNKILNFSYTNIISQNVLKIPLKIKKHTQYVDWIIKQNLSYMVTAYKNWEENKFYKCPIIDGNYAWISKDNKGIYRIFSKKNNGHTIGFNFLDLLEIVEGTGVGTNFGLSVARRTVASLTNHTYKEREVEIMHLEKYSYNIDRIEKAYKDMQKDFPDLYGFIKNYLVILEHLNAFGRAHLTEDNLNKDGVFFTSTNHIAKFVDKDQTVVSKAVNCFATLGLINKIKEEDVPVSVKNMAIDLKYFNLVNFYTVSKYNTKTLLEAQNRVIQLKKTGVTKVTAITRKTIEKAFGKPFAKKVYGLVTTTFNQNLDKILENIEM